MAGNIVIKPYPSLAAVVHQMVKTAPSGLTPRSIAEFSGYTNYNTMMSELSRQPGHKLGADMLLPLMDVCNSDAPVAFMAREREGIFLKLQQPAENGGELVQSLANTVKNFGEYVAAAAERIADGDVDPEEMARINGETNDVVEAILSFRKLAQATHDAKYGRK